jgi:hypothetical protein
LFPNLLPHWGREREQAVENDFFNSLLAHRVEDSVDYAQAEDDDHAENNQHQSKAPNLLSNGQMRPPYPFDSPAPLFFLRVVGEIGLRR